MPFDIQALQTIKDSVTIFVGAITASIAILGLRNSKKASYVLQLEQTIAMRDREIVTLKADLQRAYEQRDDVHDSLERCEEFSAELRKRELVLLERLADRPNRTDQGRRED